MKFNKKKVLVVALAVCLIAILSMGTLAWFNDADSVQNVFKFDDTDNDGTPDFKIDVFETDENGQEDTDGLEYFDIMPNAVLAKDPTVRNSGDYDMYARVIVTLSDADAWMKAAVKYNILADADKYNVLEKLVNLNAKWIRFDNVKYDATADTLTYVYYYDEVIAQGMDSESLFTKVTIPFQLQAEDMAFGDDQFTIDVAGDAIQSENITVDADDTNGNEAYDAFSFANWAAGANYGN